MKEQQYRRLFNYEERAFSADLADNDDIKKFLINKSFQCTSTQVRLLFHMCKECTGHCHTEITKNDKESCDQAGAIQAQEINEPRSKGALCAPAIGSIHIDPQELVIGIGMPLPFVSDGSLVFSDGNSPTFNKLIVKP